MTHICTTEFKHKNLEYRIWIFNLKFLSSCKKCGWMWYWCWCTILVKHVSPILDQHYQSLCDPLNIFYSTYFHRLQKRRMPPPPNSKQRILNPSQNTHTGVGATFYSLLHSHQFFPVYDSLLIFHRVLNLQFLHFRYKKPSRQLMETYFKEPIDCLFRISSIF